MPQSFVKVDNMFLFKVTKGNVHMYKISIFLKHLTEFYCNFFSFLHSKIIEASIEYCDIFIGLQSPGYLDSSF
jgi:hypothetical protein